MVSHTAPGAVLDDSELRAALERVIDPCSVAAGRPLGLVAMGMVVDVTAHVEDGKTVVDVELKLTHPSCFMAPFFIQMVKTELGGLPDVVDVRVTYDASYDWTPALIDESRRLPISVRSAP